VEQITGHQEFYFRSLTLGDGLLAYEQGGRIHRFDPATRQDTALHIQIAADLPNTRPHYQKAAKLIQNADISPTGQRALFEARGEIFSVPANKGEIRNLTHTPGAAERFPAWSPDGNSIAYFSDESGEYQLVIADQKGAQKMTVAIEAPTFFYTPVWSPDSLKIAFTDKALHLYYVDLPTRAVRLVDSDTYDHPIRSLDPAWSPDSQWLAYTRRLENQLRAVFVYHLGDGQSHQVTDGMSDATSACFSRDSKYLFFTASVNYGLNIGWLDMT
jgi:tricorn protease